MAIQEERFSLGENSERMVTVTPFMGKLKIHIRQFYVNGNGEIKPGKSGMVLDLKEFDKLVELIPQIKESIERYELKDSEIPSSPFQLDLPVLDLDTVFLPSPPSQEPISIAGDEELFDSQPKCPSPPPPSSTMPDASSLMEPSLERILSDIRGGERKMTNDCDHKCPKAVGFSYPGVVLHCSECEAEKKKRIALENMDDNSPKKRKEKGKRSKEITGSAKKKLKTENKRPSGIFVGYAKLPCEVKETTNKKSKVVKQECIDEVASVESMKEVEKKLWLEHYNQLCEKLLEVVREKCTGCQTDEANQLGHGLCLLASAKEQVNLCFEEVYGRVHWEDVMDCWYKKVLEMPIALNPETLAIFRETVNPNDVTYKNRLKKWMIESPTIEL